MKTLGEVLSIAVQFLKDKQCNRARRIAEELIGNALQLKRIDLYMQFDRPMSEPELEGLRGQLKRAVKGEPVEYITGSTSFYHCQLALSPAVLIPRPETEILVDTACKQFRGQSLAGKIAWDICTGSGCIGIAVKKAFPELTMVLADISKDALTLAGANAHANSVEVELVQGDFLIPFAGRKADIIFCNPPYIANGDYSSLDSSVRDFEPKLALLGGGDGLDFYKRLNEELPAYLNPGAKIFLEIGSEQGKMLLELFSKGPWSSARLVKDWAEHDRFFFLEFE